MRKNGEFRLLIMAGLISLDCWLFNYIAAASAKCQGGDLGTLGDSFGMVNALFSSFAVAGAVYAVILQQKQYRDSVTQALATDTQQQALTEIHALSAYVQCLSALLNDLQSKTAQSIALHKETTEQIEMLRRSPAPIDFEQIERLTYNQTQQLENSRLLSELSRDYAIQLSNSMSRLEDLPLLSKSVKLTPFK